MSAMKLLRHATNEGPRAWVIQKRRKPDALRAIVPNVSSDKGQEVSRPRGHAGSTPAPTLPAPPRLGPFTQRAPTGARQGGHHLKRQSRSRPAIRPGTHALHA